MNNEIREEKQIEDGNILTKTNPINNIEENSEGCSKLDESESPLFQIEKQNKNTANKNLKKSNILSCFFSLGNFVSELYKEISGIDLQIYNKTKNNNCSDDSNSKIDKKIFKEKLKFEIPIYKIENENYIKSKEILNIENLKKNLNSNINNGINNGLFVNNKNHINIINEPFGFNNNINNIIYNPFNCNIIDTKKLFKILEQKNMFLKCKDIGLHALMNPNNLNHNLFSLCVNKILNNINYRTNYNNNINQFMSFNNGINYYFNNLINQNILLKQNYCPNKNTNNINQPNNIINKKKYIITLKSKTNDPNIDKISKIHVTTSYVKDISKTKQENVPPKKEKNIINLKDIESGKEIRTVVRLNPIPPNYSSFDISKLLDKYLKIESGKNQRIYSALYTPLCKIIGQNLGYCFVMMVKPKYVIEFYNTFYGKILGKKKCRKPCTVIWADKQGDDFLKATEDDPIRKPIIFKDIKKD